MGQKNLKRFKLKEVIISLKRGHSLYSEHPLSSPANAVDVMRREMSLYDREVLCVVNLNARLQPINFNVVSIGGLGQSIADIPNIMKSGILSNAANIILLHNHPSGDPSPSREDIAMTRRVVEAGKLIGISCLDHIIIGAGNGNYCSMKEMNLVEFGGKDTLMAAAEILHVSDNDNAQGSGLREEASKRGNRRGQREEASKHGNERGQRDEASKCRNKRGQRESALEMLNALSGSIDSASPGSERSPKKMKEQSKTDSARSGGDKAVSGKVSDRLPASDPKAAEKNEPKSRPNKKGRETSLG